MLSCVVLFDENLIAENASTIQDWLIRINYAKMQSYVLNRFDSGRLGSIIETALIVLMPRSLWSEKSIVSNASTDPNYAMIGNPNSSNAHDMSAEAY